jgi:hypothetical protein
LLSVRIGIGDVVQIDDELPRFEARSRFDPDPIELVCPGTCDPPLQPHLYCFRRIFKCDSQRIVALTSLAPYKACGVPNSRDELQPRCFFLIRKDLESMNGEQNHA